MPQPYTRCTLHDCDRHLTSLWRVQKTTLVPRKSATQLRATSHTRPRLVTIALQALSLLPIRFILCSRDQQSKWMHNGCKVYMDSYMASNGSCFMITWTIFKNKPLEVVLTQDWETMALRNHITVDLLYKFCHVWGPITFVWAITMLWCHNLIVVLLDLPLA